MLLSSAESFLSSEYCLSHRFSSCKAEQWSIALVTFKLMVVME